MPYFSINFVAANSDLMLDAHSIPAEKLYERLSDRCNVPPIPPHPILTWVAPSKKHQALDMSIYSTLIHLLALTFLSEVNNPRCAYIPHQDVHIQFTKYERTT